MIVASGIIGQLVAIPEGTSTEIIKKTQQYYINNDSSFCKSAIDHNGNVRRIHVDKENVP